MSQVNFWNRVHSCRQNSRVLSFQYIYSPLTEINNKSSPETLPNKTNCEKCYLNNERSGCYEKQEKFV